MQSKKRNTFYTIMVIPDAKGKTFTLRLHKRIFTTLLLFLIVFSIGLGLLIFKTGEIAVKLQLLYEVQRENDRYKEENRTLKSVWSKVDKIENMGRYLRKVATIIGEEPPTSIPTTPDARILPPVVFVPERTLTLTAIDSSEKAPHESILNSMPSIAPVDGWITRKFLKSEDANVSHDGVDYAAPDGAIIRAPADGVIDSIANDKYYGILIIIDHGDGFVTRYGHCRQSLLPVKTVVRRGQAIALVGSTGFSTGPHLHYEVIKNTRHVDPLQYMIGRTN